MERIENMNAETRLILLRELGDRCKKTGADDLLQLFDIDTERTTDIYALCAALGIYVSSYDFSEMEQGTTYTKMCYKKGAILSTIVLSEMRVGIFYKHDSTIPVIRTAVAHGLGELLYKKSVEPNNVYAIHTNDVLKSTGDKLTDVDLFVEELLMPRNALNTVNGRIFEPYLSGFAEIFDVPQQIAKRRLEHCKLKYIEGYP